MDSSCSGVCEDVSTIVDGDVILMIVDVVWGVERADSASAGGLPVFLFPSNAIFSSSDIIFWPVKCAL